MLMKGAISCARLWLKCEEQWHQHQRAPKHEHPEKVRLPAAEGAFLKQATVSNQKEHVEEEIKVRHAEEEKICEQTPNLQR